jgi:raffinose/stachyose/melibiose transport system permease protein
MSQPFTSERRHQVARSVAGMLLPLPCLVLLVVFAAAPVVFAMALSFTSWTGAGPVHWVGLTNWLHLFGSAASQSALYRTLTAAGMSWAVEIFFGAVLGIYVAGRPRYRGYLAVVYFLPMVLSSTAIGIVWANLMDPNFGALSPLVRDLGIHSAVNLLGSPRLALYAVTAVVCWQFIPFNTLLFMGGRRQIPEVLYEAARLDGASPFRCLRSITLPQLRYTFVTASVLVLVGSLGYFDLFLVMTDGGPGDATQVLAMRMYVQGFSAGQVGAGSTIAVALAVLGLAMGIALVWFTGFGRMRSQREGL